MLSGSSGVGGGRIRRSTVRGLVVVGFGLIALGCGDPQPEASAQPSSETTQESDADAGALRVESTPSTESDSTGGDSTEDTTSSAGTSGTDRPVTTDEVTASTSTSTSEVATAPVPAEPGAFTTLAPGTPLPTGGSCAEGIRAVPSTEVIPANREANTTVLDPPVDIDGADEQWNDVFAPRLDGNFTGTTEQILRWGACKWGFDEDITRARAVTESSWRMSTAGDSTDDAGQCDLIGLSAPCAQSHGLLQVKGTVHEGTYPASTRSSAFGVDYALAWLRSCYEGSFTWLGDDYGPGDEWGCVGAWFSGNWWDQGATDYVTEVQGHLSRQTWTDYAR